MNNLGSFLAHWPTYRFQSQRSQLIVEDKNSWRFLVAAIFFDCLYIHDQQLGAHLYARQTHLESKKSEDLAIQNLRGCLPGAKTDTGSFVWLKIWSLQKKSRFIRSKFTWWLLGGKQSGTVCQAQQIHSWGLIELSSNRLSLEIEIRPQRWMFPTHSGNPGSTISRRVSCKTNIWSLIVGRLTKLRFRIESDP